ncbi:MAG: MraY family glycosyltransferase [Pirellulales bacterium]|nr:MraY family glycosyltransferase [Pirellulales bacterium]
MPALIITTLFAFCVSLGCTFLVRYCARQWNFVDKPDGRRKIQKAPVALGGGVAIYTAFVATLCIFWLTWDIWNLPHYQEFFRLERFTPKDINRYQIALVILASGILCLVGLYDDKFQMRGRNKLLFQILACGIIVFANDGILVRDLNLLGTVKLGMLGPVLTMGWLLLSINSFNLIDGVDGLAGTVGMLFSVTVGLMSLLMGNIFDGVVAFTLAGAIFGFLQFNRSPATIYMGDAGSMVIGLILGALALRCSLKGAAVTAFAAPLAMWTIPFLDSGMAILRRKLTGRSIYATDRGHIHHRLLTRGMTANQAVLLIGGLCLITSVGAVASIYFQAEWIGFLSVAIVFGLLVTTRIFGHVELMLLNTKLVGLGRSIVNWDGDSGTRHYSHQLQGKLQWEEKIWTALVESAERFNLTRLRLNLYLPHLHEDFHATWKRRQNTLEGNTWRLDIPLSADNMCIGTLHVVGVQDPRAASVQLAQFLDFLEPLESQIHLLLQLPGAKKPLPNLLPSLEEAATLLPAGSSGAMNLSAVNKA